ncbi:MAG: hypothetical protein AB1758_00620 [Candidatus Eremiobacterota bacterium]
MRLLIAFLLLSSLAAAQPPELYVRNRLFDGPVRLVGQDLYAPLDDLLRSLGCTWEVVDGAVLMSGERAALARRAEGSGPNPRLTESLRLFWEGRLISPAAGVYQGRLYVSVPELARAVNAEYRVNPGLGTADLYSPAFVPTVPERPVVAAGQSGSPLELVTVSFGFTPSRDNPEVQCMRGYAVVRNRSTSQAVEGVTVKVEVVDPAGGVLARFSETFGKLGPGESLTYQFPVWPDEKSLPGLRPRVEVLHFRL